MNNPSKSVHPKSTTERLLDSAERLFADKGVAATSLREITTEASANLASVSYHFGSKEGLLREVLGRRIKPVNAVRVGLLDALDARPVRASVEEIIDAFMRPIFEQPKTVRQNFSRLMARLHSSPEPVAMEYLREIVGPTAERTLNSLARSLPGVSLERIFLRVHFMIGAMLHSLSQWDQQHCVIDMTPGQPSGEQLLDELVQFSAAGILQLALGTTPPSEDSAP